MSFKRWFQEQEPKWQRLESLAAQARHAKVIMSSMELREMALLYRSAVNDLSRAQSHAELRHLEPYLNSLVHRCHGQIYEYPPTTFLDVWRFFAVEFPRCFRKNSAFIGAAFLLFLLGTGLALLTVYWNPDTEKYFMPPDVIQDLERGMLWTDRMEAHPSQSSFLMTNNIRVAINAFASGVFLGVGTLIVMFHNGLFAFGGPLAICLQHGMGMRLLSFVAAHGVIELSTIFIAGGAGMMIGFAMLFPGPVSRWQAMKEHGREATILIAGCVPLLVVAGLIEGMVSLNRTVAPPARFLVALATAILMVVYLGFSGRKVPPSGGG